MEKQVYYVLVESTTGGWALYNALRKEGCKTRIAPVPRGLQACCGMSLLVEQEDMPQVHEALKKPDMPEYEDIILAEQDINPNRDVYC